MSTAPKHKKLKRRPFIKKFDEHLKTQDLTSVCTKAENGAPTLYVFFKEDAFDCALISADDCIISCRSAIENAVLAFIGAHFVFHVGYAKEEENFLNFLQVAILNEKLPQGVSPPIGWTVLMKSLKELIKSVTK